VGGAVEIQHIVGGAVGGGTQVNHAVGYRAGIIDHVILHLLVEHINGPRGFGGFPLVGNAVAAGHVFPATPVGVAYEVGFV
jgi:hypothetical protein